jgi:hypothetical protein
MPAIENYRTTPAHDPVKPVMSEKDLQDLENKSQKGKNKLDSEEYQQRLSKVKEWWRQASGALADSRREQLEDHEYYDNIQWTDEEIEELKERGQEPVVFNQIATAIDWILGSERRHRVDWHVLPRTKNDAQGAEAKSKLLKYISDVNRIPEKRSLAFEDAVKGGVGWIEVGVRSNATREPIFVDVEDWRNIWYDMLSRKQDLTDARYLFRSKWVDLDVAMTMFPERAHRIKTAAYSGQTYFDEQQGEDPQVTSDDVQDLESEVSELNHADNLNARSRVQLIECWYRVPARIQVMRGQALGVLDGEEYDPDDPDIQLLIQAGHASVVDAVRMQVRCMIYTGDVVLQDQPSPYRHNRFPFIPIWAYRRKKDGTPYGPIRRAKSPQNDLNKRRSKALFILSTNKIVADEDVTDDWEELQSEAARPDGVIKKKRGTELEIFNETALADAHTQLMDQDAMYIMDASGVTNENLGRDTNAQSGKAIEKKQDQGMTTTNRLFDNHRQAFQLLGEILISLIEQYYSEQKQIRITGHKGKPEWLEVNEPQPDGSIVNDITASKADFIVSEDDYNESLRQSMFETLSEMVTKIDPQIGMQLLDLVMDLSDLPGKEEIVNRIREITGMDDPYADPDDPEAMKRKQAREQAKAEQQELERQKAIAEVEQAKADVEKARAETQGALHEAEKTRYEAIMELAKIDTERAKQEATRAGISFDEMKLKIEKAKALHEIRNSDEEVTEGGSKEPTTSKASKKHSGQGPYRERGMASNNKSNRD